MAAKETAKAAENTEPKTYLKKLGEMGYPYADVAGQMHEIDNPNPAYRTFGFKDANGRCEIALSATKEEWKAWFEAALKA